MEYTQFGRTSLHVSKISYGTWQFGGDWGHVEREQWEEGKATIRKALEFFRHSASLWLWSGRAHTR